MAGEPLLKFIMGAAFFTLVIWLFFGSGAGLGFSFVKIPWIFWIVVIFIVFLVLMRKTK